MTPEVNMVPRDVLPRSIPERGVLLVLSAGAIAFSVVLLALMIGTNGLTWGEWLFRLAMAESFTVLFITGSAGLVWAIAAPRWLPAVALRVGGYMAASMLIPWPILFGLMLWPW